MPSYAITGASRGVGYGFATALSKIPGNTVFALVRSKEASEKKLQEDGITHVQVVTADLTDYAGLQAAAATVSEITGGSLNVLINNAAVLQSDEFPLDQYSHDKLDQVLNASFSGNVNGIAHTINAFLPLIRKGQTKKIITLSSGMADVDFVKDYEIGSDAAYSISKGATNVLMARYHAQIGRKEGVLFLSISPGAVDTSAGKPASQEDMAGFEELARKMQKYAPDFKGPIPVAESVEMQLKVIHGATVETHGGAFVSHLGSKQWL